MSEVDSSDHWQTCREDGLWEGAASVGGMTCAACALDLEAEASKLPGFKEFELNPASGLGRWVAQDEQSIALLLRRARRLGYEFFGLGESAQQRAQAYHKQALRRLMLRWAVALLCSVQIMMFAGPEYFYTAQEIGLDSFLLLRWAQWVLVLPVILFCAKPFFMDAYKAASHGRWAIEQPIALGVTLAFVYSSFHLTDPSKHLWFDSIAMLMFFLSLSRWLIERQSRVAVTRVLDMVPDLPLSVFVLGESGWGEQPIGRLQPGQVFVLPKGAASPVDAYISPDCPVAWFDESLRTGESEPIRKVVHSMIDAGAKAMHADVRLVVAKGKVGQFFRSLLDKQAQVLSRKPLHQTQIQRIVPWFVAFVLGVGGLSTSIWMGLGAPADQVVSVTIAVLLVSCPCALALSWPLVHLFLIDRLRKDGVFVTQPDSLEQLAQVDSIVFDKTGTLAPVQKAQLEWKRFRIRGHLESYPKDFFYEACLVLAQRSNHPVSRALVPSLVAQAGHLNRFDLLNAIEITGMGVSAVVKQKSTGRVFFARLGRASFCGVKPLAEVTSQVHFSLLIDEGHSTGPVGSGACLSASVKWGSPELSSQSNQAITQQGIDQYLLSGDHDSAVREWAPSLSFKARYAGLSAQDKADHIAGLQDEGRCVLMVGDGLNDSVAFSQADVAVASCNAAAFSAKQADLVLTRGCIDALPKWLDLARKASRIGRQNMAWSLGYNVLGIGLAMLGVLTPLMAAVGMGLSSLVVLANSSRL